VNRAPAILTPLRYEDLSEGKQILWLKLLEPFRYYSAVLGSEVELPVGFECDGESVPRWLHSVVPPFGAARYGAVAHDGIYSFAGYHKPGSSEVIPVTRQKADAVYRELLAVKGVAPWRCTVRYNALRAAGWKAWNDHRRKTKSPDVIDIGAVSSAD
jgi:hypothetical protein